MLKPNVSLTIMYAALDVNVNHSVARQTCLIPDFSWAKLRSAGEG